MSKTQTINPTITNQTSTFKKRVLATAIASTMLGMSGVVLAQSESVEEVIVLGVKGAQQSAINTKREASAIVDGISAEDIGKLPDVTIADSLQRISGIQVQRDAGEGTKANIRGLPQVVTLMNGEQYLTAGNLTGAQPNLGDIPSQLMKGVDVYKSSDLTNALNGVTGTIDLKTRRPFDLDEGFTVAGATEVSTGDYTQETDPSVNGLVNWRNEGIGFLIAATQSESNLGNNYSGNTANQLQVDNGWGGEGVEENTYNWIQAPGYDSFNRVVERKRTGVNAAFEAEIGEGFKFIAEGFYTKLESHDRKMGLNIGNRWATLDYMDPVKYTDTGVQGRDPRGRNWLAVDEYAVDALWVNSFSVNDTVNSQSQNYNFQLDYDNGGNFTSSVRAIRGSADNDFVSGSTQGDLSNWQNTNTKSLYRAQLGLIGVDPWYGTGSVDLPNFYPKSVADQFGADRFFNGTVGDQGGRYIHPNPLGYGQNPQLTYNIAGDHPVWSGFDTPIAGGLTDGSGQKTLRQYMANKDSYAIGAYDGGGTKATADLNVFSAKGKYTFDEPVGGFFTAVEAGIRNSSRDVTNHEFKLFSYMYPGNASDAQGCGAQWKAIDVVMNQDQCHAGEMVPHPLAGQSWSANGQTGVYPDMVFQGYTAMAPTTIDQYQPAKFITDFGGVTSGLPGVWVADAKAFDNMENFLINTFGSVERVTRPGESYSVTLIENSSYIVGDFAAGIFSGNAGLRIIETDLTVRQNETGPAKNYGDTANDVGDIVSRRSYTDVLPSLNVSADITDDFKLRFAASRTMTPLDLKQYGGGLTVNTADDLELNIRTVTGANAAGNPNLNPWRAHNYDLSAEYYIGQASMVNAAIFYVDISSFVNNSGRTPGGRFPDQDGVIRRTVDITGPVQGDGGSIEGLELGGKLAFSDITDGFFANFGLDANYTYSPSESNERDLSGNALPFYDNSENQFNLIGWYQDDKLQVRVAYNYRSERYVGEAVQGVRTFAEATAYVDANISYDILDNTTVYLNASNLTNEREEYYADFSKGPHQFISVNEFEARYTLGVRTKF